MLSSRILYEDNHLIIVNKLNNELVQGDISGDVPLLEKVREYIKNTYHKQGNVFCGLVHRLDRPVSGAVIFAKTSKALTRMNQLVKERKIDKTYIAIVENRLENAEGVLRNHIRKNEKLNKSFISDIPKEDYKIAELTYKIIGQSKRYTIVEVQLMTGRHHQIRAQLSHAGAPIKGDLKYGARRSNKDGSISLHAAKLKFEHPVSHQMVEVEAPVLSEEFRMIMGNE
ncbi:RluA family pseudouridine synthase [Bacteroidales bacterium OttesenSCG-928-B11]|nr:RluA family pseudouridine synthase [Bacteroidales bacterium OttesenSCG-928-C03]MDL2313027.1 RluA family pseudouridine synthase [Bacteroidales bacterium OttesenSCG-928-B11]